MTVAGACALLAGCSPVVLQPSRAATVLSPQVCPADAPETCLFLNSPVRLEPRQVPIPSRFGQFFPTADSLTFVDSRGRSWVAPRGTLTDGASIPRVFIPVVGLPRRPEFVNAAAIHDAYCGIGNENLAQWRSDEWQLVHRMFYDALRAGGTEEVTAKVMFAAVYLAGPRWRVPRDGVRTLPPPRQRQIMQRLKERIEEENPPFEKLLITLEELDAAAGAEMVGHGDGDGFGRFPTSNGGGDEGDAVPGSPGGVGGGGDGSGDGTGDGSGGGTVGGGGSDDGTDGAPGGDSGGTDDGTDGGGNSAGGGNGSDGGDTGDGAGDGGNSGGSGSDSGSGAGAGGSGGQAGGGGSGGNGGGNGGGGPGGWNPGNDKPVGNAPQDAVQSG